MSASSRPLSHAQNLPARLRQSNATVPEERASGPLLSEVPRRKVLRPEHVLAARVLRAAVLDTRRPIVRVAKNMGTTEAKLRLAMAGEMSTGLHLVVAGPVDVERAVGEFLVTHAEWRARPMADGQLALFGREWL